MASLLAEVEKTKSLIVRLRTGVSRGESRREGAWEPRRRDRLVMEGFEPATNPKGAAYSQYVHAAARTHGIDPALVQAMIEVESGGDPLAVSSKGARGLMQVMPETAAEMGVSPRLLFNPRENVTAGARYLAEQLGRFNGELPKALAAYNAGPGAVLSGQQLPLETQLYVPRVLERYRTLKK